MKEWGIFSDEGLIEGEFYSKEDAEQAALKYDKEDEIYVSEICPYHRDNERNSCEKCLD